MFSLLNNVARYLYEPSKNLTFLFLNCHGIEMLQPIMHILKNKRIVLASGSPRRRELVKNIGLEVDLCASLFEENLDPENFPTFDDFVIETAHQKVLEVDDRLKRADNKADIIIGADTMVALGDKLFGKPTSKENAYEILSELSNNGHTVYTGVVIKADERIIKFCEKTKVYFGNISPEQINGYIETGEPMDKAGGYGIQGVGGTMIEKIEGDYFTVMGLPLYRLSTALYDVYNSKNS